MRPALLLVPCGIAFAIAGGILFVVSSRPARAATAVVSEGSGIGDEVRHPVSQAMLLEAAQISAKPAPYFKAKDIHGLDVRIGGAGGKPQVVYFILDGCPCSLDAQPLFNRLYQRYKDTVDFVGIINTGKSKALDYAGRNTVLHPIIGDEKLEIMKAYRARESTYNLIVRADGIIDKMWPGYSRESLQELNRRLAKMTGTNEEPLDFSLAPKKMDSGCFFY